MRMARASILALIALLVWGCAAAVAPTPTPTDAPGGVRAIEPPLTLRDFNLTDQSGATRTLEELATPYALVTFGFTHCPDVCPANLAMFKLVKQQLGADAQRVTFVFISVDPGRDTPPVLAEHLALFDPAFVGLTADEGAVRAAAQDFGVTFTIEKQSASQTDYSVTHTASSFLVGPGRALSRIYSFGTDSATIADDIRAVLQTTP